MNFVIAFLLTVVFLGINESKATHECSDQLFCDNEFHSRNLNDNNPQNNNALKNSKITEQNDDLPIVDLASIPIWGNWVKEKHKHRKNGECKLIGKRAIGLRCKGPKETLDFCYEPAIVVVTFLEDANSIESRVQVTKVITMGDMSPDVIRDGMTSLLFGEKNKHFTIGDTVKGVGSTMLRINEVVATILAYSPLFVAATPFIIIDAIAEDASTSIGGNAANLRFLIEQITQNGNDDWGWDHSIKSKNLEKGIKVLEALSLMDLKLSTSPPEESLEN